MKYSIPMKFLAITLTALMLVSCIGSVAGIILAGNYGLYNKTVADLEQERLEDACGEMSSYLAGVYAMENLSNIPKELWERMDIPNELESIIHYSSASYLKDGKWHYTLKDRNGNLLGSSGQIPPGLPSCTVSTCYQYPVLVATIVTQLSGGDNTQKPSVPPSTEESGQVPEPGEGADEAETEDSVQQVPAIFDRKWEWYDPETNSNYKYYVNYMITPEYTVTIYVEEDGFSAYGEQRWDMLNFLLQQRYAMIWILMGSLLLLAIGIVYLCCAAGRKPGSREIVPGGLNRLPLDLYLGGAGIGDFLLVVLLVELLGWSVGGSAVNSGGLILSALVALAACVVGVGFVFAMAAQIKAERLFWWRNSVIGRIVGGIGRLIRWIAKGLRGLYRLMPMLWRWLLIAGIMGLVLIATVVLCCYSYYGGFWFTVLLLVIAACAAVVCYGAYGFGTILAGARRMAKGNLNSKISTRYLRGSFADCADQLNALAGVAEIAAKNQLKSERMKTELITNVSHDIKTPLTSIINYVDLLQMTDSETEAREYLEVLGRQSQRLKKLIEDLMEMSKASTGNLAVNIEEMDAVEAVNQALGEFADKLESASLTPVFHQPEVPVHIHADGRLTWRVLSNLLSNAVKYALPGTRLYIDLTQLEGKVLVSLKNISREELNISSEELMERFVRGDTSRNTEGSGLGLNIAKSLMEVQHGQLQLLVDGDLFKATLIFPGE